MALANKELCERIYSRYKEVLDEIYLSVKDTTPQKPRRGDRIRRATVTLDRLVEAGLLSITGTLHGKHHCSAYPAKLTNDDTGAVAIDFVGGPYLSPSPAAAQITKTSVNGWPFWDVRDRDGNDKGSLADIRSKLDRG